MKTMDYTVRLTEESRECLKKCKGRKLMRVGSDDNLHFSLYTVLEFEDGHVQVRSQLVDWKGSWEEYGLLSFEDVQNPDTFSYMGHEQIGASRNYREFIVNEYVYKEFEGIVDGVEVICDKARVYDPGDDACSNYCIEDNVVFHIGDERLVIHAGSAGMGEVEIFESEEVLLNGGLSTEALWRFCDKDDNPLQDVVIERQITRL